MALPAQSDITNASTTADVQTEFEDQRDFISTLLGGSSRESLTISSGTVTPGVRDHGGVFTLRSEASASTDDLDTITNTNISDGQLVMLRAHTLSEIVTLKNADGGTGEMLMIDGADFVLDSLEKWILFQRIGTSFDEIARSTGRGAIQRVYTASDTWNKPANLVDIVVEVVGAGGAGGGAASTSGGEGSAGAGGGGGGYSQKRIAAADLGTTEAVTIGAGGTGVSGSTGNNGGTTSFGAHCSATGGSGGSVISAGSQLSSTTNAAGGSGSSGDLNLDGGVSERGMRVGSATQTTAIGFGGAGGAPGGVGGGGTRGTTASASPANGNDAASAGSGGGGASNGEGDSARAGGDGADGICIVTEYY